MKAAPLSKKKEKSLCLLIVAYTILFVPLLLWSVFFCYSFLNIIVKSFTDWSISEKVNFVKFDQYIRLFNDKIFYKALRNTLLWTVVVTFGVNFMGLLMAALISKFKKQKNQKLFLTLLFWPVLVSATASANIQKMVFAPDGAGLMNSVLMGLGLIKEPLQWFYSPNLAMFTLMIFPFFFGFGTKMLIFYAGLKNVPSSINESAYLETNSSFKIFWHITLPLLQPVIAFNLILSVIEGLKVIAPMQLITQGRPLNSSTSILLYIYDTAFKYDELGYASAIGVITFLLIFVLTLIQMRLDKGKVSYE